MANDVTVDRVRAGRCAGRGAGRQDRGIRRSGIYIGKLAGGIGKRENGILQSFEDRVLKLFSAVCSLVIVV